MENKESKIRIQWFPGHMTKAKREMQEKMKMVDMVIELRDARIPNASKNPMIEELCGQKPHLIILSKKDKAQDVITKKWMDALSNETTKVIALDIIKENFSFEVKDIIDELDLKKPIYKQTACYGHFGRPEFTWEKIIDLKY